MQNFDMYHHILDHHMGIGNPNKLYQELNARFEKIEHL